MDKHLLDDLDSLPDCALLPVPRVARLYCVSDSTVWRWLQQGILPARRIGGVTRVSLGDLRQRSVRDAK